MIRVLVDSNVLVDFLARRGGFYELARRLMIFAEMGDYEQAKATFESVRDGYNPDRPDDVKDNLDIRIQKLEELMSSGTVTETGTDTL